MTAKQKTNLTSHCPHCKADNIVPLNLSTPTICEKCGESLVSKSEDPELDALNDLDTWEAEMIDAKPEITDLGVTKLEIPKHAQLIFDYMQSTPKGEVTTGQMQRGTGLSREELRRELRPGEYLIKNGVVEQMMPKGYRLTRRYLPLTDKGLSRPLPKMSIHRWMENRVLHEETIKDFGHPRYGRHRSHRVVTK
ncbi:hypothetical protein E6H14_02490 [Candidatus Bathyarchaeota archaeon]|nr:MAG: hypothetical protein E6H14_02490 [Candidatus Bathyarchaeota archaeon]